MVQLVLVEVHSSLDLLDQAQVSFLVLLAPVVDRSAQAMVHLVDFPSCLDSSVRSDFPNSDYLVASYQADSLDYPTLLRPISSSSLSASVSHSRHHTLL